MNSGTTNPGKLRGRSQLIHRPLLFRVCLFLLPPRKAARPTPHPHCSVPVRCWSGSGDIRGVVFMHNKLGQRGGERRAPIPQVAAHSSFPNPKTLHIINPEGYRANPG